MKKVIVYLLDAIAVIGSVFMAAFSAAGLCAFFWGPAIFDGGRATYPDWPHIASTTFICLLPICTFVGFAGALAGIVVPLHVLLEVPFSSTDKVFIKTLRRITFHAAKFIDAHAT